MNNFEIENSLLHENHILSKILIHCSTRKSAWPLVSKSWLSFYRNSYMKKLELAARKENYYSIDDIGQKKIEQSRFPLLGSCAELDFNFKEILKFGFNFEETLNKFRTPYLKSDQTIQVTKKIQINGLKKVFMVPSWDDFISNIKFLDPTNKIAQINMSISGKNILAFKKKGYKWITDSFKPPYSPLPLKYLFRCGVIFSIYLVEHVEFIDIKYKRYNDNGNNFCGPLSDTIMITIFDDNHYMLIIGLMVIAIIEKKHFKRIKN